MTDESRPDTPPEDGTSQATAVAAPESEEAGKKLTQKVEIRDTGPCRKHIRVSIDQADIAARMGDHFSKLVKESLVTGFRPGKAPRKLIEKRFHSDVASQVKGEVLLASLEQVGEDYDIAPLSPPQIDPSKIDIPREGPLVYEFEVEVRPHFDLPPYRGLKLKRPVKTYTDEDVAEARRRFLTQYGQIVPKENGTAEVGDIIVAEVSVRDGERPVGTMKETSFRVERSLAFKDGMIRRFGAQVVGAKAGDSRVLDVQLSSRAAGDMGGKVVKATFDIKDVKSIRMPELTDNYVQEQFGIPSAGQLDEMIRAALERNLEFEQRRQARLQILGHITAASQWELPPDLLQRQFRQARARRIMEMKGDGLSDQEIANQLRVMEQDIYASTAFALKEHFVLQKIAEVEKITVEEQDMDDEIARIAEQDGDSPRRVRARLEKEDMLDALMAEMIERRALDLILENAEYEDVPVDPEDESSGELATVEAQAVPGEMRDPVAESAAAEAAQKAQEGQ